MRKFMMTAALLLMLCLSGAAFAQNMTPPVFCGDLSEADCSILQNSAEAMKSLDSASYEFIGALTFTNLPEMPGTATISFNGDGAFSGAAAVQSGMMGVTDMAQMMEHYADYLLTMLDNFDADLSLTVVVSPELTDGEASDVPSSITLELLLVDGVAYLNLDPLQPLINDPSVQGWWGLDLSSLVRDLDQQGMFDMMFSEDMMQGIDQSAYIQEFSDPEFMSQFTTITRIDDGTGRSAAFQTTMDFGALWASPEFQDMMQQQMQEQMDMQGMEMSDDDLQEALAMVQQMFENMSVTAIQTIRLDDYFTESMNITFNFDLSQMMAMMEANDDLNMNTTGASSVAFDMTFSLFDHNNAPALTAPAGAFLFPYRSFLGLDSPALPTTTPAMPTATTVPPTEATAEPTAEVTDAVTPETTPESTDEVIIVEPTAEITAEAPGT